MYKVLLLVSLNLLFLCPVVAAADVSMDENEEREAAEQKMTLMKDTFRQMDAGIEFFGMVLDQDEQPVVGAEVEFHIVHFSDSMEELFGGVREVRVTTDSQGRFKLSGELGRSLYVNDIIRKGYAFDLSNNPDDDYQYAGEGIPHHPDKNNPVVFYMRKMGMGTFLLVDIGVSVQFLAEESGMEKKYDFVRSHLVRNESGANAGTTTSLCDLVVQATLNTNSTTWAVVLSACGTNSGLIASDHQLFEAPETGYQNEVVYTAGENMAAPQKYVYLRSRDPSVFTRLEVEYINANEEFFRLTGTALTNPYGSRNLEQTTDISDEEEQQLMDEARTSLNEGRLLK